jgi:hypothetical protein
VGVRLRVLGIVVVLTAGDYLLWRWSVAGGHDVTAIVSGVTLVPLFIVLLAVTVRQAAGALWAARRPQRRLRARSAWSARTQRRSRSATVVSGAESASSGVATPSPPSKIAA